jgi:hypothetical protein
MKSRSFSILGTAIIFAVAGGCSASKTIATSEWRSQSVVVDGKPDEWQLPLRYANAATGLNYAISNDDQNLYFCFTTSDRRALAKITMGGLEMQIAAADMKPVTLLYPIPGTIKPEKNPPKGQEQNKKPEFKLSDEANSLQVSGFPFAQAATELPLINKYGVRVGTDFGKDRFAYEASIPLEGLNLKGKDLSVTIILKGIPKSQKQTNYNGMQQGNRTGPGGMRMSGGQPNYGGQSSYAAMFSDQKINVSMRLASQ